MTHIKQKSNVKALDFLFGINPSLLEGLCQIKKIKMRQHFLDFYLQEWASTLDQR
jgi:hypothetical protein